MITNQKVSVAGTRRRERLRISWWAIVLCALLAGVARLLSAQVNTVAYSRPDAGKATPAIRVYVDSSRDRATIIVGPVQIPAASMYNHHFARAPIAFDWPASGWLSGFQIDVLDSAGRVLPRSVLHHAGVYNLDRRQLAYPTAERLFAAGSESDPVKLPGSLGIPVADKQRMLFYYALANETARDLNGVMLRVTLPFKPATAPGMRAVMPMYFDANPQVGKLSTFDIPRGRSERRAEFTLPASGSLRYLGGHLHDFGVELRLEDARSNTVLARLRADRSADGRVHSVGRTRFLFKRNGLRLKPNHPYRVIAVYDNPTCGTVTGAMGLMVAVFSPDDMSRWPAVNTADVNYQKDLAWINEVDGGQTVEAHDHGKMQATTPSSRSNTCAR